MTLDYADDILYNFLKQEYPTYRSSLEPEEPPEDWVNPLPADTEILWGSPPNPNLKLHSFEVKEFETFTTYPFIGKGTADYATTCTVRITVKWINAGKPPVLNQFREFLNQTVNKNITGSYFTSRGISHIAAERSTIVEPAQVEGDVWILNFNVNLYYRRSY